MGVVLTNSLTGLCDDLADPEWTDSFALIRLVPPNNAAVWNTTTNKEIACQETLIFNADSVTGRWTSCELTCNDEISPAGSYYEVQEFVRGKCCATSIVQFDCGNVVYPNPTELSTVVVTDPVDVPTSLFADHLLSTLSTDSDNQLEAGTDSLPYVSATPQRLHFRLSAHNDGGPYEAQPAWESLTLKNISLQADTASTNLETYGVYINNSLNTTVNPSLGFTQETIALPDIAVAAGEWVSVRPTGISGDPSLTLYIVVHAITS